MTEPLKNLDPMIVDTQLFNNPKFVSLFSSYQKILNAFPLESLIGYANKYINDVHDPVTQEKNFYIQLNEQDDDTKSIQLKDFDNENIDIELLKSDEYKSNIPEEDESGEKYYTEEPSDPVETAKLLDISDVDVQFILYWVEKFRCIHETVKQEVWNTIPKSDAVDNYNNENVYFNNFNESLFHLRDFQYIKDRSVVSFLNVVSPREQYNKNMMMKLDSDTYNVSNDMSSKTGFKFYANLLQLNLDRDRDARTVSWSGQSSTWHNDSITASSTPSDSHGNNNVTDSSHPLRVELSSSAVQQKMNEILGDMKRVFDFLDKSTVKDTLEWGRFNHKMLVNKVWCSIDQAHTELHEIFPESPLSTRKNQDLS